MTITAKLIPVLTFTAESPGLVVADGVEATDLRSVCALVNV